MKINEVIETSKSGKKGPVTKALGINKTEIIKKLLIFEYIKLFLYINRYNINNVYFF